MPDDQKDDRAEKQDRKRLEQELAESQKKERERIAKEADDNRKAAEEKAKVDEQRVETDRKEREKLQQEQDKKKGGAPTTVAEGATPELRVKVETLHPDVAPPQLLPYRLREGKKHHFDMSRAGSRAVQPGEVVMLTEAQAMAFRDKFEGAPGYKAEEGGPSKPTRGPSGAIVPPTSTRPAEETPAAQPPTSRQA